jgi:hypothetical protein
MAFNNVAWLLGTSWVNRDNAYHLWQAIFRSRMFYMARIIILFSQDMDAWFTSAIYWAMLSLFKLRGSPDKDILFRLVFDLSLSEFCSMERRNEVANQLLKFPLSVPNIL